MDIRKLVFNIALVAMSIIRALLRCILSIMRSPSWNSAINLLERVNYLADILALIILFNSDQCWEIGTRRLE